MPESNELDLKLLDRALERHASDRQIFARDLKIAALIVLVFLFGIFFRFVDLSDQKQVLEMGLKVVGEAQADVTAVKVGLGRIADILQKQGAEVAEEITKGRLVLRSRIVAFNAEVAALQAQRPQSPDSSNVMPTGPTQSAPPTARPPSSATSNAPGLLAGLDESQIRLLKQGGGAGIGELVRSIVNTRIVPPVFADLNRAKSEKLNKPIDDVIASLAVPLADKNAVLAKLNWDASSIRGTLDQLGHALHEIQFKPPANDDWWRTVETKAREFESIRADAADAFTHLREGLATPTKSLEDLEKKVATLSADAARNKAELDDKAKVLEKDYGEVQTLIASVAKPLAAVAMEPATVVRYAPAILAAALAYFLIRYRAMKKSQESLSQACHDLGYSDRVLDVYFDRAGDLPAVDSASGIGGRIRQQIPAILMLAAPGLLALATAWRILASPSLKDQAPWFLYVLTFSALVGAYALATSPRLRIPRWGRS